MRVILIVLMMVALGCGDADEKAGGKASTNSNNVEQDLGDFRDIDDTDMDQGNDMSADMSLGSADMTTDVGLSDCPGRFGIGLADDTEPRSEWTAKAQTEVYLKPIYNGPVSGVQWLLFQPLDSYSLLRQWGSQNRAFTPDVPGEYVVEAVMQTPEAICRSTIKIEVLPEDRVESRFRIELSWTDASDSADDTGVDLDLHYLRPDGVWNTAPDDVHWRNALGDWAPDNQAILEQDSVSGFLPEIIIHDAPATNARYQIGVKYYGDSTDFGPSTATLRVFVDGTITFENRFTMLEGEFYGPFILNGQDGAIDASRAGALADFPETN